MISIMRKASLLAALTMVTVVLGTARAEPQHPGAPIFGPVIYGDGELWGTKLLGELPPPNGRNNRSFDELFVFMGDAADGQLPVAEAAPGNPDYNGGRWAVRSVMWLIGDPPLVTSYDDLADHEDMGDLVIMSSPDGPYFECPLLPVYIGD